MQLVSEKVCKFNPKGTASTQSKFDRFCLKTKNQKFLCLILTLLKDFNFNFYKIDYIYFMGIIFNFYRRSNCI